MEDVANKTAELHTRVAGIDKSKAALALAELEFERGRQLVETNNISRSEQDRRQAALVSARADLVQALANVNQTRVSLGLKTLPLESPELGQVPRDLDQTFSSVREAQAALIQSAAQLGVIKSYTRTPREMIESFEKSGSGDIDRTLARLTAEAPAVKQAEAKLEFARSDLEQAELDLRYCDVVAEIEACHAPKRQSGQQRAGRPGPDGGPLAQGDLDRRQFQGNATRPNCGSASRSISDVDMYGGTAGLQGTHRRLHNGNRLDAGAAAAGKRDGQLRQGRAAVAGPHRPEDYDPDKRRLFVGLSVDAVRPFQGAADRPQCRQVSAGRHFSARRTPVTGRRRCAAHVAQSADGSASCRPAPSRPSIPGSWPPRRRADVHGSARHDDRERRAALYRRRTVGAGRPTANGSSPATSPPTRSSCRSPAGSSARLGRAQLFPALDRRLHARLGAVRHGHEPRAADRVPRASGTGRRRIATLEPGRAARRVSARETRRRDDAVRRRRAARAGRRADARRIHHRQLRLAVDLLPQYPRRPARAVRMCSSVVRDPEYFEGRSDRSCASGRSASTPSALPAGITMVSWEVLLSKGQEWDWLGDPFWRVQTLAFCSCFGLAALIFWELRIAIRWSISAR